MGIVYYSRYLEFFEEARTELLSSIGLNVTAIEDYGIYIPVIVSHCEYKKAAKLEDSLVIESRIKEIPKTKLEIVYFVRDSKRNTFIAKGYTLHAFLKSDGLPTRAPQFLLNCIKNCIND
tara:strand:+ start:393 stop:752 length:360 start_codon:yes stop_codon:yes gene_type:complete